MKARLPVFSLLYSIGCISTPNDTACQDSSTCNGNETSDPSAGNANATTGCVPSPGPLQRPNSDGIAGGSVLKRTPR